MARLRWIVGAGALLIAFAAFYVLMNVGSDSGAERIAPALDDIDARSRAEMRELLRDAAREE